ncbi:ATP-binding protein [Streptomyces sp. 6N223]|uniref:ATP-binding protein n=1 Tax=Streptomyces sp. 6N223 TaxID=3457412 RepID=UPI003FD29FFA
MLASHAQLTPLVPLFTWSFPREPASVGRARSFVRDVLSEGPCDWVNDELRETVVLLVSEVAANAVRHGAGPHFGVECHLPDAALLRVSVYDDGDGRPRPRVAGADDEGGRGLALLDLLADEWRCERMGHGGKVVAFTVKGPRT